MNDKKKVAIVTGAGQGLGKAIVEALASSYIIYALDINEDNITSLAKDLSAKNLTIYPIRVNVGEEKSVMSAVSKIEKKSESVDVLINNAGIDVTKSVEDISPEEWFRVLQVNLYGPFLFSKKILKIMKEKKQGNIINIVSTAAKRAWPNASAYHASKWGLLGFSYALFTEAREIGVKVTALVAGGMRTPFILERFPDTPLNVLQDPKNVAETIKFILSLPKETIIPEVMVLPMKETSWP